MTCWRSRGRRIVALADWGIIGSVSRACETLAFRHEHGPKDVGQRVLPGLRRLTRSYRMGNGGQKYDAERDASTTQPHATVAAKQPEAASHTWGRSNLAVRHEDESLTKKASHL